MRRFYDGAAIQAFLTIPLIEDGIARFVHWYRGYYAA